VRLDLKGNLSKLQADKMFSID